MNNQSIKKITKLLKKTTDKEYNNIMDDINSLPKRYQDEFIQEVLVDEMSIIAFTKVFAYYLDDIWEELTIKEKQRIW